MSAGTETVRSYPFISRPDSGPFTNKRPNLHFIRLETAACPLSSFESNKKILGNDQYLCGKLTVSLSGGSLPRRNKEAESGFDLLRCAVSLVRK
jgi:hypothetical protein